jgi:16S rRNA (guanine527-N7)-methyltransferase
MSPIGCPDIRLLTYAKYMSEERRADILTLGRQWAFSVAADVADSIALYMQQLLLWNERVNLTGARNIADLLGEHLPDSFALAKLIPEGAQVIDVGSGAGLPAIPFAILRSDCQVTLVEPRAKRVAFLNTAVRTCGCKGISILRKRFEDLHEVRFSVATSRATFSPEAWLKMAPSLLSPNGMIIVLTTSQVQLDSPQPTLIDSIEYRSSSGASRWAGSYCFT